MMPRPSISRAERELGYRLLFTAERKAQHAALGPCVRAVETQRDVSQALAELKPTPRTSGALP